MVQFLCSKTYARQNNLVLCGTALVHLVQSKFSDIQNQNKNFMIYRIVNHREVYGNGIFWKNLGK